MSIYTPPQKESEQIDIIEVEKPTINFIPEENRTDGISGFMRLRNEAEFLERAVDSWMPLLDELIIVYNNCQDDTGRIALACARKYPGKIKVYHYHPIVTPQGSSQNNADTVNSPHNLVYYYNYALSKTTRRWAIKIDGDQIIPTEALALEIRKKYEEMREQTPDAVLPISGVNLIDNKGKLYVPSSSMYCTLYGDLCLFRVDEKTRFVPHGTLEALYLEHRTLLPRMFAYYHMKFIKADFGIGNYNFQDNPHSHYYAKTYVFLLMLSLIPLSEIAAQVNLPEVTFESLALPRKRAYSKEAIAYLRRSGGRMSLWTFLEELHLYAMNNYNTYARLYRLIGRIRP